MAEIKIDPVKAEGVIAQQVEDIAKKRAVVEFLLEAWIQEDRDLSLMKSQNRNMLALLKKNGWEPSAVSAPDGVTP